MKLRNIHYSIMKRNIIHVDKTKYYPTITTYHKVIEKNY